VEVSLLSQQLPSRLGLLSHDLGRSQFNTHLLYFFSQSFVLIIDISYEAYVVVLESTFLLKLIPLLMENVQGLRHCELLQKVSDEIINHHFSLEYFGLRLRFVSFH
jgi:hypothetical protein